MICVYAEFREPKPGVGGGGGGVVGGGRGSDPELTDSWGCGGSGRARAGAELQLVRSRLSRILEESEKR